MQCPKCRQEFPEHLVNVLCINGENRHLCPICALEMIREVHEQPNYEFRGAIAKANYEEAVEWIRRAHDCSDSSQELG